MRVSRERFDAVLFDLDGVLTATARLHAEAWKRTFDEYLETRAARSGEPFRPFDSREEYKKHIDGKLRYDGVASFLESRGIRLPWGSEDDPPDRETVCGLGNQKNELAKQLMKSLGVEVFEGSVRWVRRLREEGFRTGVVSASRNCEAVLSAAGIAGLFDARVDGVAAAEMGLAGKPAPDMFLEGARRVGAVPGRTVVVEDAISGVQAARAGGFGFIIGVDRKGDPASLERAGADLVVADLGALVW